MLAANVWQTVLDGIGSVLSWIYDHIPSYGVAIIILTILIRLILLPLGIKQIRSMHAMQAVQPKIKAIQAKYKNNKQKAQEEIMKVYQEHGVNPLGGCLPLLLQMPVLIALYSVLRYPVPPEDMHVPQGSDLQQAIILQEPGVYFLGANLLCSASQAGNGTASVTAFHSEEKLQLDCGTGLGSRLPIYFLILLMVGSTYFQQWQMQRAAPPGSAQKQQQMIARVMPVMFLFFFWRYPSGMVLYWATSNVWQIGQQHFLLRAIKREAEQAAVSGAPKKAAKKGLMARMMEQAEEQRRRQGGPDGEQEPPADEAEPGPEGKGGDGGGGGSNPKQGKGPGGKSGGAGGSKGSPGKPKGSKKKGKS
jgi:YidC/Oxa1 family membrane protein insertase